MKTLLALAALLATAFASLAADINITNVTHAASIPPGSYVLGTTGNVTRLFDTTLLSGGSQVWTNDGDYIWPSDYSLYSSPITINARYGGASLGTNTFNVHDLPGSNDFLIYYADVSSSGVGTAAAKPLTFHMEANDYSGNSAYERAIVNVYQMPSTNLGGGRVELESYDGNDSFKVSMISDIGTTLTNAGFTVTGPDGTGLLMNPYSPFDGVPYIFNSFNQLDGDLLLAVQNRGTNVTYIADKGSIRVVGTTNALIMRCPDGGSFVLTVKNDGTLNVVTNSGGL